MVYSTRTRVHARIPNGHPREEKRACRTKVRGQVGEEVRIAIGVRVGPVEFKLYSTALGRRRRQSHQVVKTPRESWLLSERNETRHVAIELSELLDALFCKLRVLFVDECMAQFAAEVVVLHTHTQNKPVSLSTLAFTQSAWQTCTQAMCLFCLR